MNTENIAHYFYGSAPAEDELMNAVFSGENTVDALKTAANQHEFLYTEKIRLWNELHMALVGCPGTEPISHEPLSQAIVGVDFVDDGQVAYTLLEDLDDIVSALNEVDEDAFLDKYLQQNGVENRDAALAEFRTLRDFYNKCQDFHGDDDYILVVGIYRDREVVTWQAYPLGVESGTNWRMITCARRSGVTFSILPPVTAKAPTMRAGQPFVWTVWKYCGATTTSILRMCGRNFITCGPQR